MQKLRDGFRRLDRDRHRVCFCSTVDNAGQTGWAAAHNWLIRVLWSACGLSIVAAIFRLRWARFLLFRRDSPKQELRNQEIHGSSVAGDVKNGGARLP